MFARARLHFDDHVLLLRLAGVALSVQKERRRQVFIHFHFGWPVGLYFGWLDGWLASMLVPGLNSGIGCSLFLRLFFFL